MAKISEDNEMEKDNIEAIFLECDENIIDKIVPKKELENFEMDIKEIMKSGCNRQIAEYSLMQYKNNTSKNEYSKYEKAKEELINEINTKLGNKIEAIINTENKDLVEKEKEHEKENKEGEEGEKKVEDIETVVINPKVVEYCKLCHFPIEYCKYTHKMLLKKIEEGDGEKEEKKDEEKKEGEQGEKEDDKKKDKKKKKNENKVIIEQAKRGKKKHITYIMGLDKFGLVLKDVAKQLSKKMACSCTVTKEDNGEDSITLTGEFADDVKDFILENFKNIEEKNIQVKIDKK